MAALQPKHQRVELGNLVGGRDQSEMGQSGMVRGSGQRVTKRTCAVSFIKDRNFEILDFGKQGPEKWLEPTMVHDAALRGHDAMGSGLVDSENQFLIVALAIAAFSEDQLGVVAVTGLSRTPHRAEELHVAQFGCLANHLLYAFMLGA